MTSVSQPRRCRQVIILNDNQTPRDFVIDLLRFTFGKSEAEAKAIAEEAERHGKAACGVYPVEVADAVLKNAREQIGERRYKLAFVEEAVDATSVAAAPRCAFCGKSHQQVRTLYAGKDAHICDECILRGAGHLTTTSNSQQFKYVHEALAWHFAGVPKDHIVASSRQFPGHMRADLQGAVQKLFAEGSMRFLGIHEEHRYETLTIAALTKEGEHANLVAPTQYQEVDIGEAEPVKCLDNGLWFCREGELPYAVLLSHHREYGLQTGIRVEIAVPAGEQGSDFTQRCFRTLESAISVARSYRGKILSLEQAGPYTGKSTGILVHRLPPITRQEVILPAAVLSLLDRNVLHFVRSRDDLRSRGQATKKGVLLYGPPGNGKTHTIRYLASNLPGHTTVIITAEQVGLLQEYMNLARLLQPSLVVIEDADLIARSREAMNGPCEEVLLNKLLNEMDGLREDADIIFVLTTNRPEQLEAALASRPGRIDQAIEIPRPDEASRAKLVKLYGRGLNLSEPVIAEAVRRTAGVSASFIKELIRRTAQASIERGVESAAIGDLNQALDDMLFTGGRLNTELLGGVGAPTGARSVERAP